MRSVGQHILTRPLSDSVTRCTNLTEKKRPKSVQQSKLQCRRTVLGRRRSPSRLAAYVVLVVSVEKDYFMRAAEVMLLTSGKLTAKPDRQ